MNRFSDSPFEAKLEVVSTLAEDALQASREELIRIDRLTLALRGSMRDGVGIDDLSAATGLAPREIIRRTRQDLNILNDLEEVAGTR